MGSGPNGSGITISKPDPSAPRETYQERQLRLRRERRKQLDAHHARQKEFLGDAKQADESDIEDKQADGPPENKAMPKKKAPRRKKKG